MILTSRPASALRHFIRYYYQVDDLVTGPTIVQPVPASSRPFLNFMFGDYHIHRCNLRAVEKIRRIALVGAGTYRRVELLLHGKVDSFTIAFQPGGIPALFAAPASKFTDDDFDADSVFGRELASFYARLGEQSSFQQRVQAADEYLCSRRPDHAAPSRMARLATHVIQCCGNVGVDELARASSLSLRQLERRFRLEIGVTPKQYARIVRFELALTHKAHHPQKRWTEIAHGLGYYDQTHMIHDFRYLAGDSPGALGNRLEMFIKPEVDSRLESLRSP